jgi:hypothetical protein
MDLGAVEYRKSAVLSGECKKQVGSAEDHGLGPPCPAEVFADSKKRASLGIGDSAGCRHRDIGIVDPIERIALGQYDPCRRDAAIEPGFHDRPGADDPDRLQVPLPDRSIDFGYGIEQWQGRHSLQFVDAEVPTHRRDGSEFPTRRRQASNQARKDFRLSLRGVFCEVPCHLTDVGVHDREVQDGAGARMPLDQTT